MLDDYERYQGIVLRQIVVGADTAILVRPFTKQGRVNAFVLDDRIGVFVKHSSKRMSPWRFTFHRDQVLDLVELEQAHPRSYGAFVCGGDGLAVIEAGVLRRLVSFGANEQAWVRIERKPRSLYGVSGNLDDLENKVPKGVAKIHEALRG